MESSDNINIDKEDKGNLSESSPNVLIVKRKKRPFFNIVEEPKYELRKTGTDVAEHEGFDWIELVCPYCKINSKFHAVSTVIVKHPTDKVGGEPRSFHSLLKCSNCNDIIYVLAEDYDYDPDWFFIYRSHYPRAIITEAFESVPQNIVTLFKEAEQCYYLNLFNAMVLILKKLIEETFKTIGNTQTNSISDLIGIAFKKSFTSDLNKEINEFVQLLEKDYIEHQEAKTIILFTSRLLETIFL